ncbi:transposase [Mucilaginibacter sp. McL0603]|uniref:transposase n=1 Tax=Mucilaginibacter sp. McL0603 TaxID=3415670 RepID=UPI003CFB14A9
MAIRTNHQITDSTWFITFTCFNWIPLFDITQSYDLIYNWLKLIDSKYDIKTLAYVIMPNHIHLLLEFGNDQLHLNTIISNGKRFMAYAIIQRLVAGHNHAMLNTLALACSEKEKAKGQLHKVFEPSFDAKPIYSMDFLYQKLDYIHHNPVSGKWNLCNEFTDYLHSSASYYELEKPNELINIVDYRDHWV